MCGICGATKAEAGATIAQMNDLMRHRGPTDGGVHIDPETGVGIGARRLAIIDVKGGRQPVANEDQTSWAVLNGEIYNHPRLQSWLLRRNHVLRNRSDTEVLVHLYEEYEDEMVHALEGMYAFALWDARRRRLLLARDRFGEKPLFYSLQGGELTFASEATTVVRALSPTPEVESGAVANFFAFGYVPGPMTMFDQVYQLPPGHTLAWDANTRTARLRCYWRPSLASGSGHPLEDLVAESENLLDAAVRSRLIADVPLGIFLSGGVDSALVAALAARNSRHQLQTFSVGYDSGSTSETKAAKAMAALIGTRHHEVILTETDVRKRAPSVLRALDQPLADEALVASHALAEFARSFVTVAVGGEGADELFCGYPRYRWLARMERLHSTLPVPLLSALTRVGASCRGQGRLSRLGRLIGSKSIQETNVEWTNPGHVRLLDLLAGPRLSADLAMTYPVSFAEVQPPVGVGRPNVIAQAMWLDQTSWLVDDVLAKADRSSMLVSLEVRTPYLERTLVEFANSVPISLQCGRAGKPLIRGVLRRVLPQADCMRRKTAFRVPAAEWLRGPLASILTDQLKNGAAFREGWLDREAAEALAAEHLKGGQDWTQTLWRLLSFGLWLDRFRGVDCD